MNLPPDNHTEPASTGTQTVLESLKKGIVDSSLSAVKAVQVKTRPMVSQNKRRYQEGVFDLDMTYITENIIAMEFPAGDLSSGLLEFFEVASFPFNDHNCPPLHLIKSFCQRAYSWLKEDIENVVVHCKAGMGRTGLMICSLLLFLKFYPTAEEVIDYFNQKRCLDGKALRYVKYFEHMLTCFHGENRPGRRGFRLHKCPYWIRPSITVSDHSARRFLDKAPKKGIVLFALPREPGLAEVAGGFKIHFHDLQGYFYCGMDSESADSSLQPDDVETSTEKTTLVLNSQLILRYENSFIGQQCVTAVEQLSQVKLNSRILQDSIVKQVNENPKAGWKAALNPRFSNYTVGEFKSILGVKPTPKEELMSIPVVTHDKSVKLPTTFDARTAWPNCSTIGKILVEALSDRFCIHFGSNIPLSVNDLLACCDDCGSGCDGGFPIGAWKYFVSNGVVTEKCDPYFDPIGCSHPGCKPIYPTPECVKKCVKGDLLWNESKHYSVDSYLVKKQPADIMAEVYKNGPVQVSFIVYEDFAHKSGVYKHVTGEVLGGHSVKLIGWGTSDEGEDYWLLANQWNRSWGDDGFFKIIRGVNECGIEDEVVAGLPSNKHVG
ncbi:hypothetical protein V6N11_078295 [Hibiscus sabdariffa]|uniref:Phosphatidylinositol-3,4,5-trisphosphate 3-phosphatase n=1 Tax=Hibiscus sabdariffa TaxID=183260 RepID=A0ABR2TFP0_9ROSI